MDKDIMNVRMKKWIEIIRDATESGQTKKAYMSKNGISRRQFYYWQKKIREYVLQQKPELGLPASQGQIQDKRETNSQMLSLLPVFCELKPEDRAQTGSSELLSVPAFTAEAMIKYGQYQIYIDGKVSERTLSTILAVIRHD